VTFEEAIALAESEFQRYQELFLIKEAANPGLTMEEVDALVEYEHPVFENSEEDDQYNAAMLCVGLDVLHNTLDI
jgi:hypothetical protein